MILDDEVESRRSQEQRLIAFTFIIALLPLLVLCVSRVLSLSRGTKEDNFSILVPGSSGNPGYRLAPWCVTVLEPSTTTTDIAGASTDFQGIQPVIVYSIIN